MKHDLNDFDDGQPATATHVGLILPYIAAPTREELAHRRSVIASIPRIRVHIGPVNVNAVDLIDADFYELDAESV